MRYDGRRLTFVREPQEMCIGSDKQKDTGKRNEHRIVPAPAYGDWRHFDASSKLGNVAGEVGGDTIQRTRTVVKTQHAPTERYAHVCEWPTCQKLQT